MTHHRIIVNYPRLNNCPCDIYEFWGVVGYTKTYRQTIDAFQIKLFYTDYKQNLKQLKFSNPCEIFIFEIIQPYNPDSKSFDPSIKMQIDGLVIRNTWNIMCSNEVSDDANMLCGRFILVVRGQRTSGEVWKARFIV